MTMTVAIPSSLQEFVQEELAAGSVRTEEELVARALELYREMKSRHSALKAEIDQSLAEANRGETAPLDIASLKDKLASELTESGEPR
jgi:Arc/MetJ-type ribon-helix-helix transcriptional regulator